MRRPVFAAVLGLLVFLYPAPAGAGKGNQLTVGPTGQFATIQEAVDAALPGDQVSLEDGVYNESVVIAGKENLTLRGARTNAIVIGTTGHTIALLPGGGLSTRVINDDIQLLPVGQGSRNSACVESGADGICETTADTNDDQEVPVGQGFPNSPCVRAGADAVLDTAVPVNDDVIELAFLRITTGPDGICDTTADPSDDQTIPVGQGAPDARCIDSAADGICETTADPGDGQALPVGEGQPDAACVGSGSNSTLQTAPSGDDTERTSIFGIPFIGAGPDGVCDTMTAGSDDVVDGGLLQISSGPNGICDVAAGADETQVIPVGQGTPGSICVSAGADATLDTVAASGDDVLDAPGMRITSGPDGVCDTTADAMDVQALPVGRGTPNSVCITADNPLVRNRNVRIQNLGLRSPSDFDGINVDRSDFVEIANVLIDGTLGPAGAPATGRRGVFLDARSVKPVIKSSTVRLMSDAGFLIQGSGAEVSTSLAELNGGFGFLQQLVMGGAAAGAVFTGNTAQLNGGGGFGIGGFVNIYQRCTALQNIGPGFLLGGVGNILFQVGSTGNSIGVDSFGAGTRVRSSQIFSNLDAGIVLRTEGTSNALGSEISSNVIFGNRNAGVRNGVNGVVMRLNQIGPRKLTIPGPQDVGVLLQPGAGGTVLELNKLQNNFDTDGDVCPPAGTACDLVNQGMNNAGRLNTFNAGFVPPPGFVD